MCVCKRILQTMELLELVVNLEDKIIRLEAGVYSYHLMKT